MSANPGQEEYWRQTAGEYGPALERLAWAYEADPDRRADLLQEIDLALWRSFEKFDGRCSLRTWVYRVAHNVAISHVGRRNRWNGRVFLTLEEVEAQEDPHDLEESTDRQQALSRLLVLIRGLDLIDRQLIVLYLEDLDAGSISQITGLSVANVRTRIHRIKNVLTRRFDSGAADAE